MIAPLSNQNGEAVDWWLSYKLPVKIGPQKNTTGFEFLYADSSPASQLSLSPIQLDHSQSALGLTLDQVFSGGPECGYVLWNDEIPPTQANPNPQNNGSLGHSKGVLAFSKKNDCGFYLLHSTPRFPVVGEKTLPDYERQFGQTYLCVSLKDYDTANQIAAILHCQNEAQVYASHLPESSSDEPLCKFANKEAPSPAPQPANLRFLTSQGSPFHLIAKNKSWSEPPRGSNVGRDFWKDLIGPTLNCDTDVESWRRGTVFGDLDQQNAAITEDIVDIDLGKIGLTGYSWPFEKDHAKWGIATVQPPGVIVISDINRQLSQDKRGGGGLAFQSPMLWQALDQIQVKEKNVESSPHHDQS